MAEKKSHKPLRAAQYVRMSTEHQQYSTDNQKDVIRDYAAKRGIEIVATFEDAGKSGLNIEGRASLQELISVIESGKAEFNTILVYDVSRWGRFQDADESAHWEFLCKRGGVQVRYCAEPFENDGTGMTSVFKAIKRTMAGTYSEDLSRKVFRGQERLIKLGYRQGGLAGYGLRRMLLDDAGRQKGTLRIGEKKSLQTDRVILVPGPPEEVATVRRIYRLFLDEGQTEGEIAQLLNAEGIRNHVSTEWTRGTVREVLTNEKYIGANVYNHRSFKLKIERKKNPPEEWIRRDGAFEAIVESVDFYRVRAMLLERFKRVSDEDLLARLRELRDRVGRLSGFIIDETEGMASSCVYQHRFGSLVRAYRLIGYIPDHDYEYLQANRMLRQMHPEIVSAVVAHIERLGARVVRDAETDLFVVNDELTVSVVLARFVEPSPGTYRWHVRLEPALRPDLTVVTRLEPTNRTALDYYILPVLDMPAGSMRLAEDNGLALDSYRFETLDVLWTFVARVPVREVA